MGQEFASVFFGLASALVWGSGDFCGGLGTRRASVLSVLVIAESSGLVLLVVAAFFARETMPSPEVIGWGIAGGLSGTVGLAALYRGLAIGRASVVAPISAVVSAIIPALVSAFTIGLPDTLKLVGFVLALVAIALASQASHDKGANLALGTAFVAGLGFGGFFVFIHLAGSQASTFVPLSVARAISIPVVLAVALARRTPLPARDVLPIIILSGLLDAGGNVLFLIASTVGRLDVATILSSLYPASTVILSRVVSHEKISRLQQVGVALALVAIVLIALPQQKP